MRCSIIRHSGTVLLRGHHGTIPQNDDDGHHPYWVKLYKGSLLPAEMRAESGQKRQPLIGVQLLTNQDNSL